MENKNFIIRTASPNDAEEILSIYAPYVRETAISFEYEPPAIGEFRKRISGTLEKYPYIAAESGGEILGYAYTGPFKSRAAYDWAVETSIYLRRDKRRAGLGKALYTALEDISKAQNILNLNACIACPQTEDAHLDRNSIGFHEHMGYKTVGVFHKCGFKFDTWYDMVWMEKMIGVHGPAPKPVIPFPELEGELLRALGILSYKSETVQ